MYKIMICVHCKMITTISLVNIYHHTVFFLMRTFKIYYSQLWNTQYNIINYNHHAIHHIPRPYLYYSWKFITFDHLHSFCPPSMQWVFTSQIMMLHPSSFLLSFFSGDPAVVLLHSPNIIHNSTNSKKFSVGHLQTWPPKVSPSSLHNLLLSRYGVSSENLH